MFSAREKKFKPIPKNWGSFLKPESPEGTYHNASTLFFIAQKQKRRTNYVHKLVNPQNEKT